MILYACKKENLQEIIKTIKKQNTQPIRAKEKQKMVKEYLRLKDQYPELDIDSSCGRLSVVYRYKNEKFHICLYFDQYKEQLENFISKFLAAKEAFEKNKEICEEVKRSIETGLSYPAHSISDYLQDIILVEQLQQYETMFI